MKQMNEASEYKFFAHRVETWNWLLGFAKSLHQHPERRKRWICLSPVYWAISVYWLFSSKGSDVVDTFSFSGVKGQIELLRNFFWHFIFAGILRKFGSTWLWNKIKYRILNVVIATEKEAEARGVHIALGLGAATKDQSLTQGGEWVLKKLEEMGVQLKYVSLLHGDTLTAAGVIKMALALIRKFHIKTSVFVSGSTSKIGRPLVILLAKAGVNVKMLTGDQERFETIKAEAGEYGKFLTRAKSLKEGADCLFWITGKALPRNKKLLRHIPKGAVVMNFSVPNPLSEKVLKRRPDVYAVEGGLAHYNANMTSQTFLMRCKSGETYWCHVGTAVHAHNGWTHHEVGPVDLKQLPVVWKAARELGFSLLPLPARVKVTEEAVAPVRWIKQPVTVLRNLFF
ncbi:MAG: hypothetical protein ABIC96_03495 [Patescibacteria group bacterium]